MAAAGEENRRGRAGRGAECEIENLTHRLTVCCGGKVPKRETNRAACFNRISLISAGGRRMEAEIRTILGVANG